MKHVARFGWALVWMGLSWFECLSQEASLLQTRAERTEYRETSTYADVMEFCRGLTNRFSTAQLTALGRTSQDRELPLLILAEPVVTEPAQVGTKPVILCLGNIHGGEVCGKEALLMLARELGLNRDELLRNFIVLLVPIYNADGNEPVSKSNRPQQNGPATGVGTRVNGAGLDLNRDFMKLEASETRALVKLLRDWDPIVVIDTHATNGSKHRYALTYDGPRHPGGIQTVVDYARSSFLPEVSRKVREHFAYDTYFYGNFEEERTRWETYPPQARYGIQYVGLRGRLGILTEAYAYATFQERVEATLAFVRESLRVISERRTEILDLLKSARQQAAEPTIGERVPVRARLAPFPEKVAVKGVTGELAQPGEPKDYEVEHWGRSEAVVEVRLPYAYLVPRMYPAAITNLLRHGIKVEELRETLELETERYRVEEVSLQDEPFQGHRLARWKVNPRREAEQIQAGTWVVRTAQPLGRLAVALLEPESEDGLAAWNFFDETATPGSIFPVARVPDKSSLLTRQVPWAREERRLGRPVTFDAVYGTNKADFVGSLARVEDWSDGRYLQLREGVGHLVDPPSGRAQPLFDEEKVRRAFGTLPELGERVARTLSHAARLQTDPAGQGALFQHDNDLYYFRFDGSQTLRLTRTPEREELEEFSPDGKWVSFVRGGNLYVVDISNRVERALTTDGSAEVRNGKASWVYFEELYDRKWKAYWWSPDSRQIAFLQSDERRLPMFHALDTVPLHGRLDSMRHPKAGDPNPEVRLGVVTAAGGAPRWAPLAGEYLLVRVGWMPQADTLYCYIQDRAQTWLDFQIWDLKLGEVENVFRETSPAWVDDPGPPLFGDHDDLILPSRRGEWRHLYRFNRKDKQWMALTEGDWEVRNVHGLDRAQDWIYFNGTRDSHLGENLYRCRSDGKQLERLTAEAGHHEVSLSPDFKYIVDRWSDFHTPARVQLRRADGSVIRLLDSNPVYALEEFEFGPSELVQVPARDGFQFEGMLTRPAHAVAGLQYPVWFMTYGGPQASNVRDAWGSTRAFDQLLAAMGVVVFRMDPRSASGKGNKALWSVYRQLGLQELSDIEEGINWLKAKPYVDGKRIGMSGHSYGGFMTAYALTHSSLFTAGIAGAPVTDWRYYDSIYTERYMDTPQNNPDGYAKSSVVKAAKELHGRLLILHGMMDDNVHLQNATALVQALQKAEKDFEIMFYPEMQHGLQGQHYHRLLIDFIRRGLRLDKARDF